MITGFTSRFKLLRDSMKVEPVTRQPVNYGSEVLETKSHLYTYQLETAIATVGGSASVIVLTAPPTNTLIRGDIVRITSGTYAGLTVHILSVSGSSLTLASDLPAAIGFGITLSIERWAPPKLFAADGGQYSRFPVDQNPVETWVDDFSSARWGVVAMGAEDNLSTHPLAVDLNGKLIISNDSNYFAAASCPARGRIAAASITSSYTSLLSMTGNARHLALWNSTDQELLISYDNGSTDSVALDAGEFYAIDFVALGTILVSSTIVVKWVTAQPKAGSVRAVMIR